MQYSMKCSLIYKLKQILYSQYTEINKRKIDAMKIFTFGGSGFEGTTSPSPKIDVFMPEGMHVKAGIVIFPGGGYWGLAEHEGRGYAEFFCSRGIASFVVSYRLGSAGHRHPAMIEDAVCGMISARAKLAELGFKDLKVGTIGSSAGGHLCAHLLTRWHKFAGFEACRPDFGVLCYPVITMKGEFAHTGSRDNLLGQNASAALVDEACNELHVSPQTPPCFLWHTCDDAGVPVGNSLIFADALRRNKILFELHVYRSGRHGLGMNCDFKWNEDCVRWIGEVIA